MLDEAIRLVDQANAGLSAAVLSRADAELMLARYARAEKAIAYGMAALAARVGDAAGLARVAGTSVGRARQTIATGRVMSSEPRLAEAVQQCEVSLEQAEVIARTAAVAPNAVDDLVAVARSESFRVLTDRARTVRQEADGGSDLAERQHRSRRLRHWVGDLGMIHIDGALEPHVGVPIVNRLEARARRLARAGRRRGEPDEPFERYLADALPAALESDGGSGRPDRAEMVVLVSYEVARRGWKDVRTGEHCKIPGVGPVAPQIARRIAGDAFLTGVFYDGTDLRHLKRWSRGTPAAVRVGLQLGDPPEFDGLRCVDCGNRFGLEFDHVHPVAAGGPTALANIEPRCHPCHVRKTNAERAAGLHGAIEPRAP
jgi:hypothetical protein